MNTLYTPRSKYYAREASFRALYPLARIERHAASWKALNDEDVIAKQLLGFPSGEGRPHNTARIWIVARKSQRTQSQGLVCNVGISAQEVDCA
jgi:hypothetical protein